TFKNDSYSATYSAAGRSPIAEIFAAAKIAATILSVSLIGRPPHALRLAYQGDCPARGRVKGVKFQTETLPLGAVFEAASRKPHVSRLAHRGLYQGTNRPKRPDRIAKQTVVATTIPISVVAHIERTNPRTAPAAAHMITLGLRSNSGMATPVYFSRSFPEAPGSLFFDGSYVMSSSSSSPFAARDYLGPPIRESRRGAGGGGCAPCVRCSRQSGRTSTGRALQIEERRRQRML